MNKKLAISAIVLVAVVMGMSAVAPMIPPAFAHDVPKGAFDEAHKLCELRVLPSIVQRALCTHGG